MTLAKTLFTAAAALLVLPLTTTADTTTIDWNTVYQRIDGFGGSSAYFGTPWTEAQADLVFSPDKGIGLSLLRIKITGDVTGTANATKMLTSAAETSIAKQAIARGARVWATPWSPPAQFKTTGNTTGGSFISANNQAYANMLGSYVSDMKNAGVNLYALSIQNEPDFIPGSYEGCGWTAQQFHDFVPFLYNAMAADGVGSTRIMLPESDVWQSSLESATISGILSDPAVAPMIGVVAGHDYAINNQTGSSVTPANLPHQGKALWETEVATTGPYDATVTSGMYVAQRVHLFLTAAQANAWHCWWFMNYTPGGGQGDNSGLFGQNFAITKRAEMLGQFAKFVRPGYYRISATTSGNALISAYKDPITGNFAIVALNTGSTPITETFTLSNMTATSVTPCETSASLDLATGAAIPVTGSTFTATLDPTSTTTFIGTNSTPAPGLSPSKITNLSIRSFAGTSDQTLIAGFYVQGGGKSLLIRGAGPVLASFGVSNPLQKPQLTVSPFNSSTVLASNAGWDTAANWQAVSDTAARMAFSFPRGSADSAVLQTVPDGLYSAQITGVGGTTGIALAEIYDTDSTTGGRLVNVSARTITGPGDQVLSAGFNITGSQPKTLLIRAVGPGLIPLGVSATQALPDPVLKLFLFGASTPLQTNQGWDSGNPADVVSAGNRVGAFTIPNDSNDSALVVTLQPGLYTAQVASAGNNTGVALIEIYEVQ